MEHLRLGLKRLFWKEPKPRQSWEVTADRLLQSIKRMEARGMDGPESSMLGHVVGAARRDAGMTFEDLAERSGLPLEDIIDLNLGTLRLSEATQLAEKLKTLLPINEDHYRNALLADSKKETPL